ncbi:MAG: hypothetical protein WC732_06370 [Candidatus Omnitrophota bacterium]
MVEKALFENTPKPPVKDIDRLYFGNEFCEGLIPGLSVVKARQAFAQRSGKPLTFVTPYVTDKGLTRLYGIFKYLNKLDKVEVVFNDWGVFSMLREEFSNLVPVMGRLLTRQRRDPRILRILAGKQKRILVEDKGKRVLLAPKPAPETLLSYHRSCGINAPWFQDFLLSRGIRRVEVDNLLWGMDLKLKPGMSLSVYYPFGYISTGRQCPKFSLRFGPCARQCQRYCFRFRDASLPVPFYGIGGTLFYQYDQLPLDRLKALNNPGLRLVRQSRLPF